MEKESLLCRAVPVVAHELSTQHISWLCWRMVRNANYTGQLALQGWERHLMCVQQGRW